MTKWTQWTLALSILFSSPFAFSTTPNQIRMTGLQQTLQSQLFKWIVKSYEEDSFGLHGLIWVNTVTDGPSFFKAEFKKFDLISDDNEDADKKGMLFVSQVTTCEHLFTLSQNIVTEQAQLTCVTEKSSFKMGDEGAPEEVPQEKY